MSWVVYTQRLRTAIVLHPKLLSFRGRIHVRTTLAIAAAAAVSYLEAHVTRGRRRRDWGYLFVDRHRPWALIARGLDWSGSDTAVRETTGFVQDCLYSTYFPKPRVGGRGGNLGSQYGISRGLWFRTCGSRSLWKLSLVTRIFFSSVLMSLFRHYFSRRFIIIHLSTLVNGIWRRKNKTTRLINLFLLWNSFQIKPYIDWQQIFRSYLLRVIRFCRLSSSPGP